MSGDREIHELAADHSWKVTPGYRIFVMDRGAVRFEFPEQWVVRPDPDSVKLHDREPPDDDCTIAVSYHRLPPGAAEALPIAEMVRAAIAGDERGTTWQEIVESHRFDMSIAWREGSFRDQRSGGAAITRLCLARRRSLQALITIDLWESDRSRVIPVWDHLLASLELDEPIADPLQGPPTQ